MYLGRIVELAECDELFDNPLHPYTRALLAAVPVPDPTVEAGRAFQPVQGEVPSPINPPPGCVFHPRCPLAVESCKQVRPELRELRPGPLGGLQRGALARLKSKKRQERVRGNDEHMRTGAGTGRPGAVGGAGVNAGTGARRRSAAAR